MNNPLVEYPYKGQPLTPKIIEELILEVFQGRLAERREIVAEVLRAHAHRGGRKARAEDLARSVKNALERLKQKELAENPSLGYWRIAPAVVVPLGDGSDAGDQNPEFVGIADESISGGTAGAAEPPANVVIGSGPGTVYLHYLPACRVDAERRGGNAWPCKIGRTDGDPLARVLSQASTALPERPCIALAVRTSYPVELETAPHCVPAMRGLRIDNAPGSEWFLTSPGEVQALVVMLDPKAASS